MEDLLLAADAETRSLCARVVEPPHLLLALGREPGPAGLLLISQFGNLTRLRHAVRQALHVRPPLKCRACGYDLRATPERCPECGTDI
jgi:lipopolysaccharide biosynthesis regulator YciM